MRQFWFWLQLLLWSSCNSPQAQVHVPLQLLNNFSSKVSNNAEAESVVPFMNTKVPSKRNVISTSMDNGLSASNFITSYQNQQNVIQLVRNIDMQLKSIRTVEMRVATIQEIFDAMHFSYSSYSSIASAAPNAASKKQSNKQSDSTSNKQTDSGYISSSIQQDLQIFSKRLTKKLQKATHVVLELRDFFRQNITHYQLRHQLHLDTTMEGDDEDNDLDFDVTELESPIGFAQEALTSNNNTSNSSRRLYLNTFIQACQSTEDQQDSIAEDNFDSSEINYNRKEIQILNYLKTDQPRQHLSAEDFVNLNNIYSLHANAEIVDKIHSLKTSLTNTHDVFELPPTYTAKSPTKLQFLGNHFKHIYFLSRSDSSSDQSEIYFYDMNFRHLYVSAIKQKFVCLMLDIGSAMNLELIELTKTYVNNILQLLSPGDKIAIITVSDTAQHLILDSHPLDKINGVYQATKARKNIIQQFLLNLAISPALTNHSLGFEYAFQMLHLWENASLINTQQPLQFVYVTRGLLTNLSDAMHVLQIVSRGQQKLQQPVIINTCAVVLDEKRIMYEKQFLSDISAQNYTKYDMNISTWFDVNRQHNSLKGKLYVLTKMHPDTLLLSTTAIFQQSFEESNLQETLKVHQPIVETNSEDVIVPITHTVQSFGVVGVNLYLSDLIEDIISYHSQGTQNHKHSFNYAFLMDNQGLVLSHPAFPRPLTLQKTPYAVDIAYLENSSDFGEIRKEMLKLDNGQKSIMVSLTNNGKVEIMQRTYYWQSILGIYVLCLVSTSSKFDNSSIPMTTDTKIPLNSNMPLPLQRFTIKDNMPAQFQSTNADYDYLPAVELLYHRLDLIPRSKTAPICRYFHQIATMDSATLFLSASAFESPFTFLHNNRISSKHSQVRTMESIMAYLKDSTGLLANPGLRPQIRNEVNALYSAMQHLKKRHQDARGIMKNNIIRRYIATLNGVLQVYPGCLLSGNYEAAKRSWFQKALQQPGKIITTEPYLDAGGAGYITTIAHTIFEAKPNELHSIENNQAVAIVAIDIPYAYYYKMILDSTPLCQQSNIKCLLFESEGYLIAHPSMLEPSTSSKNLRRPQEHLTHKESFLASDILNHKYLVQKLACANYQNRTLQRYYTFNTSLSDILGNVVHGERTKYAISVVRGSNIFAAVLNSTNDGGGGAFCPCSTIDRICLNCNRMDQTDCECPCQCAMEWQNMQQNNDLINEEYFSSTIANYTQQYAYCQPPNEQFSALPLYDIQLNSLPLCVDINCDVLPTQRDCLAVMGCQWCMEDMDGNSFGNAFCTSQTTCFNGVLSSPTPYGDLDDADIMAHVYNPRQTPNSYSAVGPIGGAIIVLILVIGFAIYCYRHNLDSHERDQFYMDSMQEENYGLPLSRFNFDDCQALDDASGYDHIAAQRSLRNPADISPYHMSAGSSYRRPPNGESDHGYSTMTPHEDSSDHQCFTLAEPLLLNDKRNSKSDTLSISTSISSPTNRHHHHQPSSSSSGHFAHISKNDKYNNLGSPLKKYGNNSSGYASPAKVYEQTTLPLDDSLNCGGTSSSSHYILAPVTVHRHMETSES